MRHVWQKTNAWRVLVGKPEGKILLTRPRHGLEDNIKVDLKEGNGIEGCGLDESGSVYEEVLDFCKYGNDPLGFIKCGVSLAGCGTRRTWFRVVCYLVG
jgi:hypothetical protein